MYIDDVKLDKELVDRILGEDEETENNAPALGFFATDITGSLGIWGCKQI